MSTIRREVLTASEANDALAYTTDLFFSEYVIDVGEGGQIERAKYKYDRTVAIGTGSSYQYPHAMFSVANFGNGNSAYQVYPPIVNSEIQTLIGQDSNAILIPCNAICSTGENIPLFPKLFHITYATGMSTSYSHTYIPSFNPITGNGDTQYAYMRGQSIHIKDPLITKAIPNSSVAEYSGSFPSNMYSYFRIELNANIYNTPRKTSYHTTYYPIAYTKQNNVSILRRQNNMTSSDDLCFITDHSTSSSTYSYYIYKYFWKGQEITNLNEIANIMPRDGIGNYVSGNNISGGMDPSYFRNDPAEFAINATTISNSQPATFYGWPFLQMSPDMGALFNMFLIKVNGNENMMAFGKEERSRNLSSINVKDSVTTYIARNNLNNDINVNYSIRVENPFGSSEIIRTSSQTSYVQNTNNPIKNTTIYSMPNSYYHRYAAANIRHKNSSYHFQNVCNTFSYVTYNDARTLLDLNGLGVETSVDTHNNTLNYCTLLLANQDMPKYTCTASSSMPTYTYCYLAADMAVDFDENTLVINRVLSYSYLAIQRVLVQGNYPSSNMYTIHLASI